jgi:hypothetical protein
MRRSYLSGSRHSFDLAGGFYCHIAKQYAQGLCGTGHRLFES